MSFSRRQRSALPEPARELITRVTGIQPGTEYFDICSNFVNLHLYDVGGMGGNRNKSIDHQVIDKRIQGISEKLSLNGHDSKADALLNFLQRSRRLARSLGGGDSARIVVATSQIDREEAAQNSLSSILLILLELSESPTLTKPGEPVYKMPSSLVESNRKPKTQAEINKDIWMTILKEDPYVGEHWYSNTGADQHESDGSDYEDMDVNPRVVPDTKDDETQEPLISGESYTERKLDLWKEKPTQRSRAAARLKLLERQQYWKDAKIIPKKSGLVVPFDEDTGIDIQDHLGLNSSLQQSKGITPALAPPVIDEADLVQEVLLLLQGLTTVVFCFKNGSTKARFSTKVALSHLSPGALESILRPFMETAEEIKELQRSVDIICSAPVNIYGKTIQALASGINSEILELRLFLSNKQKEYQRYRKSFQYRMASLLGLHVELEENLSTAKTLLRFMKSCPFYKSRSNNSEQLCRFSTNVLSNLFETMSNCELSGDSKSALLFLRLLQQSIKPFLLNIECWLSGRRLSSVDEFLIRSTPNIDLFASNFWTEGYFVQTEFVEQAIDDNESNMTTVQIIPCFLSELSLNQMIYTGKAIRIIQALSASEASNMYSSICYYKIVTMPKAEKFASSTFSKIFGSPSSTMTDVSTTPSFAMDREFPNYGTILAYQHPLLRSATKSSNLTYPNGDSIVDYTNTFDIQWKIESELAASIKEQYQTANTLLKTMLFTQSRLLWHLRGMAEFNFMMEGEAMHQFSTMIFTKMLKKRPWYDSYVLASAFNQTATLCHWKHSQFTKVKISNQAKKRPNRMHISKLRLQDLDQIEFEYLLPWPLAGIVYSADNAKKMYSRITCLLFQVKTAKHAMEQSIFLKSKPKPSPELNQFWKLRLRFLSITNDLWSYFMMTILDAQIKKFHSEIEGQGDLDDIINLCSKFILLCYERCFLKERTAPLHRSLITILSLAIKFSVLFSTFMQEQGQQNLYSPQTPADPQRGSINRDNADYLSKSGRRVSFNNPSAILRQQNQGSTFRPYNGSQRQLDDLGSDSEDETLEDQLREDVESEDQEQEEHVNTETTERKRRGTTESLDGVVGGNEDVDMNNTSVSNLTKKQKINTGVWQGTSRRKQVESYAEQLMAIEQEFNRCREFLAKSLRVVVSSNAARGYIDHHHGGGGGTSRMGSTGQSEGDSNYLDGLILALSS
ncbi:hypothetical protein BGZ76_002306 [Entomortierella beljakovae]|nr:hypothetical protein BGZ76_002306 [Entomortierella beljakovae]